MNNTPWFYKQLPQPTTDDIEMKVYNYSHSQLKDINLIQSAPSHGGGGGGGGGVITVGHFHSGHCYLCHRYSHLQHVDIETTKVMKQMPPME